MGRGGELRRHHPWWLFASVSAAVLLLYWLTLPPSVVGGDSGELILSADGFGSPHPPGYPLFAILGHLAGALPGGTLAWRLNLLTAVCGAAAAGVLAVATARWGGSIWAGIAAAGLFAFSPLVWEQSTGAEVFALNHLLVSGILLCAVSHVRSGEERWVWGGAVLFGLGMANHHTILFVGLPLAALLLWHEPGRWLGLRPLGRLMAAFGIGLLPYLYLPLASWNPSEVTWGDQRSLDGFLTHVLRRDYGTLRLGSDHYARDVSFLEQLGLYGHFQVRELLFAGAALAAVGVWRELRAPSRRLLATWTLSSFVAYILVFHWLANLPVGDPLFREVQRRFWQMPHLLASAWAGLGLVAVGPRLGRWMPVAALLLAATPAVLHFQDQDRSRSWEFLHYAESLVDPLPRGALLLVRGDLIVNTTQYAQLAAGVRPDVRLLDLERLSYPWMRRVVEAHHPDVRLPGSALGPGSPGGFTLLQLVEANVPERRVFLAGDLLPGEEEVAARFGLWPLGLARELVPADEPVDVERWARESERSLPVLGPGRGDHGAPGSWSRVVRLDRVEAHHRHAVKLLEIGIAREERRWLERSIAGLEALTSMDTEVHPLVYRNLGLAYSRMTPCDPACTRSMREAWRHYLRVGDPEDPTRPAIRRLLESR